jgi:hypothetical protein
MNLDRVSEYHRDQWNSFRALEVACRGLSVREMDQLKGALEPYLHFRRTLDAFQQKLFGAFCRITCFDTRMSACCSFESIFTFFADQAITYLLSTPEEIEALLAKLEKPNRTARCVYLGESGCLWKVRPIACAMFLCDQARATVFSSDRDAEAAWERLRKAEKAYTYPTRPVLFDDLERVFIDLGVDSPHMYFHKSPGLVRLKARSGAGKGSTPSDSTGSPSSATVL